MSRTKRRASDDSTHQVGKLHIAQIVQEFLAAYPTVTVWLALSDGIVDLVDH
jgi:DNA-binding transcriptional LysR family regulator